jgi:hypothetical protein
MFAPHVRHSYWRPRSRRAILAYIWHAQEGGPNGADAQKMVLWLDKLTYLGSSIRTEVSSPESSRKDIRNVSQ